MGPWRPITTGSFSAEYTAGTAMNIRILATKRYFTNFISHTPSE
jgi:hypothetical protein